jgi:hypothetical protein
MILENVPFGISTNTLNTLSRTSELLFPNLSDDGNEIYVRTHNALPPGEQLKRNYNWPIDPHETRFGKSGPLASRNKSGTSQNPIASTVIIPPEKVIFYRHQIKIIALIIMAFI